MKYYIFNVGVGWSSMYKAKWCLISVKIQFYNEGPASKKEINQFLYVIFFQKLTCLPWGHDKKMWYKSRQSFKEIIFISIFSNYFFVPHFSANICFSKKSPDGTRESVAAGLPCLSSYFNIINYHDDHNGNKERLQKIQFKIHMKSLSFCQTGGGAPWFGRRTISEYFVCVFS